MSGHFIYYTHFLWYSSSTLVTLTEWWLFSVCPHLDLYHCEPFVFLALDANHFCRGGISNGREWGLEGKNISALSCCSRWPLFVWSLSRRNHDLKSGCQPKMLYTVRCILKICIHKTTFMLVGLWPMQDFAGQNWHQLGSAPNAKSYAAKSCIPNFVWLNFF